MRACPKGHLSPHPTEHCVAGPRVRARALAGRVPSTVSRTDDGGFQKLSGTGGVARWPGFATKPVELIARATGPGSQGATRTACTLTSGSAAKPIELTARATGPRSQG
eukprot:3596883-Prymnesium_polylepis.1